MRAILCVLMSLFAAACVAPITGVSSSKDEAAVIAERDKLESKLAALNQRIHSHIESLKIKYESLDPRVNRIAIKRLEESGNTWTLYREDFCAASAALAFGGSPWFIVQQDKCMVRLDEARLKELETLDKQDAKAVDLGDR